MAIEVQKIPNQASVVIGALEGETFKQMLLIRWALGQISFEGDEQLAATLKAGVVKPATDRVVTPADGFDFLLAVSASFNHPYFFATEVILAD